MKNIFLISLLCAGAFLTACNTKPKKIKPDIAKDTLVYTYKTIKESATDCGNKPDSSCTVAKINYPVFNNQNTLNDTVSKKLIRLFDNEEEKDLASLAKNFIASYQGSKKRLKSKIPFRLSLYAHVIRQDSSLTTIEFGGSSFTGNAHPISETLFLNWDTKAEKVIALDDILTDKAQLTPVAEKIFRKNENLKDTSSLARDYFFKGNKFALNKNFLLSPVGIRFLYNQYEIKPYAAGTTDLFIPYPQIKKLLKPKTVLSQFIK